jgi:urease accessory protein UreE
MWCETIVRNAADDQSLAGHAVDYVDIRWDQRRATLKAASRAGEEIRVLLPRGQTLRHGDVLFEDTSRAIVINVIPCEVIVAQSEDSQRMALLAWELGNLHWPTQVSETELIFLEGDETLAAAHALGLGIAREVRRFDPLPVAALTARPGQTLRILRSRDVPNAQ